MPTTATLKRHAALVDRMAESLGLDLEEKMLEARLDVDDITDAVLACTGCSNPDGCERWLDTRQGKASRPPEICRNYELFERLKAGKRA
ncbi:MAG: DUF6455 family protein [Roseovarius sp.]|nr:DUF6455 family protein [Roseovarius sp.]